MYGSIVIHPKEPNHAHHADVDQVLVLSDWTNENPNEVLRTLKRGSECTAGVVNSLRASKYLFKKSEKTQAKLLAAAGTCEDLQS